MSVLTTRILTQMAVGSVISKHFLKLIALLNTTTFSMKSENIATGR